MVAGLGLTGLVLLGQLVLGWVFVSWLDTNQSLHPRERLLLAIALGLVISGFLLLAILLATRSWFAGVIGFCLVGVGAVYHRRKQLCRWVRNPARLREVDLFAGLSPPALLVFLTAFALHAIQALTVLVRTTSGNLASTSKHSFKDIAYHLDIIGRLAADPFVLEHPVASGARLNYPFIVDLLTAFYQQVGAPFLVAWYLPVLLFGAVVFFLLLYLGQRLYSGPGLALALVLMVVFGSGLSFLWYFQGLASAATGGWSNLLTAIRDYPVSNGPYWNWAFSPTKKYLEDMFWMVPSYIFFSIQRAFPAGTSLFLGLFLGLEADRKEGASRWRWLVLWGLMPLVHTHTFIAMSLLMPLVVLTGRMEFRSWVKGTVLASVLMLPQLLYLFPQDVTGGEVTSFMRPWFGWIYCGHNAHWFFCDYTGQNILTNIGGFLVKNFGVLLLVWVGVLTLYGVRWIVHPGRRDEDFYVLGGVILFLIPLTVKLQPWIFDNNKLFFYWWLLGSLTVLFVLDRYRPNVYLRKGLVIGLVAGTILSGLIEVSYRTRVQLSEPTHSFYDRRDRKLARWIRRHTRTEARFLTGKNPDQFIPMLTGRSIYRGLGGWLWSQGKNTLRQHRKEVLEDFFRTGDPGELCRAGVDYVLWDKHLTKNFRWIEREAVLANLRKVYTSENPAKPYYGLYELRCEKE